MSIVSFLSNLFKRLIFFFFFYSLNSSTFSQTLISGTVSGSGGIPLIGTTIFIKETNNGAVSDSTGHFSIRARTGDAILFSHVGYNTRQIILGTETELNIFLVESISNLEEVIMIGYGTLRKKDLTGAVGSVAAKDFNKGIFSSPDQLIQGKISGVQITYNNGQPGGTAAIRIRGNSALTGTGQPLIVIDGVPLDGRSLLAGNNPLNFINPDDIASIDILKDASATAIYGSRAAFGVMLINTKKGQTGQPKIEVGISVGVSSVLKKIEVLNAAQFREAIKYYDVSPLNDKGGDVDAFNSILQKGLQQNYTFAVMGGNENGKFRVSGNFLDQEGIVKRSGFKKYGMNATTNFKFLESKKLGLDLNLNASQYIQDVPDGVSGSSGIIQSALQWNPTDSLVRADGTPNVRAGDVVNPVSLIAYIKSNLKVSTILASISPYYRFTDWLEYKLLWSFNYSTGTYRHSIDQALIDPFEPRGYAEINNNELTTTQITQTLNLNKDISPGLHLIALAGFEFLQFKKKGYGLNGYGVSGTGFGNFGLDYTNYVQYSSTSNRGISSYVDPSSEIKSFFGRTIFDFEEKYLLTATLRADGSSKFGANNKYGYFPSFAAAWVISKEDFFKIDFINSLKIRAGWGITGNQEFPSGSSQARYSFFDNGTIRQVNNPNPDLKWQSDKQYDIGIDFSILNNRVTGTLDYFNKTTTNLLFPSTPIQPAPPTSVVRWINLDGEIVNKGFEIQLSGSIINNRDFGWDLSANASFLKNEVSKMLSPIETGYLHGSGISGTTVEVIENGHPMNTFFTRKFLGMDKDNGFAIYEDDGNTFYYVGDPNPKTLLGISTTLRYRKFRLTANMYGAYGQDIFYNTLLNVINVGGINAGRNIGLSVYEDPVKESVANPVTPSSRFIVKGNYLKMSNLSIAYSFGEVGKVFKEVSLHITGQNLFILTSYPGFDPEANFDGSANNVPSLGIDFVQYPSARTILLGINFSL